MKLIKINKKGEAADKSQRELMGLILSLLIVVVVVALIFKIFSLFAPQEDTKAKALFLRIVEDIKYLEPNSSIVEFLGGEPKSKFKGEEGYWGLVVFPKDQVSNKALSCKSSRQNFDGFEYNTLTRNENVAINCEEGKICACLFFALKNKKEISFTKCDSISTKLDLKEPSCFWFYDYGGKTYTRKFYINSGEDSFILDLSKTEAQLPLESEEVYAVFNDIANRFENEFERVKLRGITNVLDKGFFNLSKLKELGDYGIAIYSLPLENEHNPTIYLSLVKKPDNLRECFSLNENPDKFSVDEQNILKLSSEKRDELYIFNNRNMVNCRMYIYKTDAFEGKNFVVFANEYNPLSCSYDGFLKYNNPYSSDYYSRFGKFEKELELILLFEDTFTNGGFKLKLHAAKYAIAQR